MDLDFSPYGELFPVGWKKGEAIGLEQGDKYAGILIPGGCGDISAIHYADFYPDEMEPSRFLPDIASEGRRDAGLDRPVMPHHFQ